MPWSDVTLDAQSSHPLLQVGDVSPAASGSASGMQQQWHQRRRIAAAASSGGGSGADAEAPGLVLAPWQEQLARRQARAAAERAASEAAEAASSGASSATHEAAAPPRSPPGVQAARRDDLPQSQTWASRQQVGCQIRLT